MEILLAVYFMFAWYFFDKWQIDKARYAHLDEIYKCAHCNKEMKFEEVEWISFGIKGALRIEGDFGDLLMESMCHDCRASGSVDFYRVVSNLKAQGKEYLSHEEVGLREAIDKINGYSDSGPY
ncbi:hypothetical protein ACFL2R_02545 [Patescibacteria group bacterium]